ncbi:MAG: hypothetical protein C7B46_18555 [Sulfobacillus benefaciens]|uniref:Asl1-like glycosyl hydrolase catalytic domain-containing protein n=1 Tax=Sulfobacillus benefaciens TaxID=453960 RepID=A0A2T2X504_9FIRM|nr:MAG: hypothetical protein C7B46_18555 [Sulfobacillus benefaciens]
MAAMIVLVSWGVTRISETQAHRPRAPLIVGMNDPQWTSNGYEQVSWGEGLNRFYRQTHLPWIAIDVVFAQTAPHSLIIHPVISLKAVNTAINEAEHLGLQVLIRPLIVLPHHVPEQTISFATTTASMRWFSHYWAVYSPFVRLGYQDHVGAISLGTELSGLQTGRSSQWNHLIDEAYTMAPKTVLLVSVNWSDLQYVSWMHNPHLAAIGVDAYFPLAHSTGNKDVEQIIHQWIVPKGPISALHKLHQVVGKPLWITEVGYPNRVNALVHPWKVSGPLNPDGALQANAYAAALAVALRHHYIQALFFYALGNGSYNPGNGAEEVLRQFEEH